MTNNDVIDSADNFNEYIIEFIRIIKKENENYDAIQY